MVDAPIAAPSARVDLHDSASLMQRMNQLQLDIRAAHEAIGVTEARNVAFEQRIVKLEMAAAAHKKGVEDYEARIRSLERLPQHPPTLERRIEALEGAHKPTSAEAKKA